MIAVNAREEKSAKSIRISMKLKSKAVAAALNSPLARKRSQNHPGDWSKIKYSNMEVR